MLLELDTDIKKHLFDKRADGLLNPRVKKITRTRPDFFFTSRPLNEEVHYLDRFQSFSDFKNDIKKIILIPFVSVYLASTHELTADLDFISATLDAIFLDKEEDNDSSILSAFYELGLSIYYPIYGTLLCLDACVELSSRIVVTLIEEILELFYTTLMDVLKIFMNTPPVNPTEQPAEPIAEEINSEEENTIPVCAASTEAKYVNGEPSVHSPW